MENLRKVFSRKEECHDVWCQLCHTSGILCVISTLSLSPLWPAWQSGMWPILMYSEMNRTSHRHLEPNCLLCSSIMSQFLKTYATGRLEGGGFFGFTILKILPGMTITDCRSAILTVLHVLLSNFCVLI